MLEQILHRLHPHARFVGGEADTGLGDRRPQPGHLHGVEARLRHTRNRRARHALVEDADDGAVLGRHIIDVVRGREPAGARHVLRYHGGIARQVIADMAGHQPPEQVIGTGHAAADDHADSLAGKVRRLGAGGRRNRRGQQPDRACSGCGRH
jgi:hypothetical protein